MAPVKEVIKVNSFDVVIKDFEKVYNQVRFTSQHGRSKGGETTTSLSIAGMTTTCTLHTIVTVCSNGTLNIEIQRNTQAAERCCFRGNVHFVETNSSAAFEAVKFCKLFATDRGFECVCGSQCRYRGCCKSANLTMPIGEDIPESATIRVEIEFLPFYDEPVDSIHNEENSILKSNIAALRKSTESADVKLICNGKHQWAHKLILSARSDVFAALFSHKDTKEVKSGEVHIEDCDHEAMEIFLSYIYEGAAPPQDTSFEVAKQLMNVANKYNVPPLKDKGGKIILARLNEDNAVQVAHLGSLYDMESLKKAAMASIAIAGIAGRDLIDLINKSGFRLQAIDE